jgi:hypothetical protein
MRIMVFLHGTIIMHISGQNRTKEERVKQVIDREKSVMDFASYIPVDNAVMKLSSWHEQGAEISYLSSHKKIEDIQKDNSVLRKFNFPNGEILFRKSGEDYKDIVEKIVPNILVEDDCESIGGEKEMVYPHTEPGVKTRIKSIVVKEFGGIDHLPDEITDLMNY